MVLDWRRWGLLFWDLSVQTVIRSRSSVVVIVCNAMMAGSLLFAYLTDQLAPTSPLGTAVLLVLFVIQIICVALPTMYLGDNLKP